MEYKEFIRDMTHKEFMKERKARAEKFDHLIDILLKD